MHPSKGAPFLFVCSGLPYIVMGVGLSVYSFVGRGLTGNSSVKSGEIIDAIQICRFTINPILKGYFAGVKIKINYSLRSYQNLELLSHSTFSFSRMHSSRMRLYLELSSFDNSFVFMP